MPGSAHIFGLLPCSNFRKVFGDKPRTITMDGENVFSVTENNSVETGTAVIQYFVPFDTSSDLQPGLYFVEGRLCSVDDTIPVGEGHNIDDYDLGIDADHMHLLQEADVMPLQTYVSIGGITSVQKSPRSFQFDIKQWCMGQQRRAGHVCYFAGNNRRFSDKPPLPRQGATVVIAGCLAAPSVTSEGDNALKRMIIDIKDIAFLAPDSDSAPITPVKGKPAKFAWGSGGGAKGKGKRRADES